MKKAHQIVSLAAIMLLVAACGGKPTGLAQKQAELKQKQAELTALRASIATLKEEIAQMDTTQREVEQTLVTVTSITNGNFSHFVEVSGTVKSRRNVSMGAESSGTITKVLVKEGDRVKKGQLLVQIDAEVLRRNIAEVKTRLELATTLYERQKRLWDQNVGTEVQFLQAQNNKESLERNLAALNAQLLLAKSTAPFNGRVDKVFVNEGETAMPGMPLLRVVSLDKMYIEADLAETYIGKFNVGQNALVYYPSLQAEAKSKLEAVSRVVDANNRTFTVEVGIGKQANKLRPNQLVVVKIKDFEKEEATAVPTNLIQRDNKGDFVYVVEGDKAVKKHIDRGITYKDMTLVQEGLTGQEQLIDEGAREVVNGMNIKVVQSTL